MWRLAIDQTWDGERIAAREAALIEVELDCEGIRLALDAPWHGDPPPAAPPGSLRGLWNFEVVELFVLFEEGRYLELELGPHGHWLLLELGPEPRRLVRRHEDVDVELSLERCGLRWRAKARIRASLLGGRALALGAFAIHGEGTKRRFLAMNPSGEESPDFHLPALWRRIGGPILPG